MDPSGRPAAQPPSWAGDTLTLPLDRDVRPGPPPAPRPRSTLLGPTASRPPARGRLGRRLVVLAFWLCLAAGLWLWWRDTPAGSIDSVAGALEEAGRITGMIGGYALLVQVLLMSRVGWLERHIGANELPGCGSVLRPSGRG